LKDDGIYLMHIRDALVHISDYTAEGKDSFFEDTKIGGYGSAEFVMEAADRFLN
jgi:hypothetical protein